LAWVVEHLNVRALTIIRQVWCWDRL